MEKSLVLFVATTTGSGRSAEENLGIAYLASVCRNNGIDAIIIDGWLEDLTVEEVVERIIGERTPLWVGFSSNMLNGDSAIKAARMLKQQNYAAPLIAGGFGPTFDPKKFLSAGFDFVAMQEGEGTVLGICDYLLGKKKDKKNVAGLCYYDDHHNLHCNRLLSISNLDEIPFPCRDTMRYIMDARTPVNVLTSRGCKANCLFCSVDAYWKLGRTEKWRERSIKNIIDEIEQMYLLGVRHIKFVDDSFIEPPRDVEWCNDFANEILRRGIHIQFRITLRSDRINEEMMKALCRAGCDSVACGIENYSNSALKRMGKRATSEQNCRAMDIFRICNLYVQTGFILFDYGTTLAELKENYDMMKKYSWAICKGIFSEMYAAKGTKYTETLIKSKVINGDVHYGNYIYDIADYKSRMAYHALKDWHIHHIRMYNMVIEPLNKPKALNNDELAEFYELYSEIRKRDLEFFGDVLEILETETDQVTLNTFIKKAFESTDEWYREQKEKIENLYDKVKIVYMAEDDPFTVYKEKHSIKS